MTLIELTKAYHLQGSFGMGHLTHGDAPCGRLPWAILGRTFGAENKRLQERPVSMGEGLPAAQQNSATPLAIGKFRTILVLSGIKWNVLRARKF